MFAPKPEKAYVKGVLATLERHDYTGALSAFQECLTLDRSALSAYWLGGYCSIKIGQESQAIQWLEPLVQAEEALPDQLMHKYQLDGTLMEIRLPMNITPSVVVEVEMSTFGGALLLAELYQEQGDREKAIGILENLVDLAPDAPAIALSLAELYHQAELWEELATMPVEIDNTDDLSAEVLRYKAGALRRKGMQEGALELLKEALKSKKRHPEVLKAARYERGLTYMDMGKTSQARKDFERLYAEDSSYADVSNRIEALG